MRKKNRLVRQKKALTRLEDDLLQSGIILQAINASKIDKHPKGWTKERLKTHIERVETEIHNVMTNMKKAA